MNEIVNKIGIENFDFDKNDKTYVIKFEKIINSEKISHMDKFILKKRAYHSIYNLINTTLHYLFNTCKDKVILPYLGITYEIKNSKIDYPLEQFQDEIIKKLNNKVVVKAINDYVDNRYVPMINTATEKTKRQKQINEELQFTDEHVIILLKCAESMRLCIPLICDYSERRNYPDINELLYDIFKKIITIYQGDTNIIYKLNRFIYSRIVTTKYSDKPIWSVNDSRTKDENILTEEFLKDIIIGIIPKSIFDKNMINLIHVVIKKKLSFEFQRNYKITFKPVNLNQVDSEGLTQFDRWEINLAKKNESKILINQFSIKYQIKNILRKLKIDITKDEFLYYKERIIINKPQTNLLFLFAAKYMGSYWDNYSCSKNDYIILLIIFYKWLKRNSFNTLAEYMIALPDKLNEKRIASKTSKIIESIITSKNYTDLLKTKYSFIHANLESSNIIIKIVGNMSVSKYIKLIPYDEYVKSNETKISDEELVCKIESLSYELLEFIATI